MWIERKYVSPATMISVFAADVHACRTTGKITAYEFLTKRVRGPLVLSVTVDGNLTYRAVVSLN